MLNSRVVSVVYWLLFRGIQIGGGYLHFLPVYLRRLPVDILKIDRSFTNDESAASLVKLIIDTGHLLGARVTAEGIETSSQARELSDLGSDELQGYLFGRPVPPDQIRTVIDALATVGSR